MKNKLQLVQQQSINKKTLIRIAGKQKGRNNNYYEKNMKFIK